MDAGKVGFMPCSHFERCLGFSYSSGRYSVTDPDVIVSNFGPQVFWKLGLLKHCLGTVHMCSVSLFNSAIRWWWVMNGEMSDCSSMFEMVIKFITVEFSTSIASQDNDFPFSLNSEPCPVLLICFEDFWFLFQKINMFFMTEQVLEKQVIITATYWPNRSWTPDIKNDFITIGFVFSFALPRKWHTCGLRLDTSFREFGFGWHIQIYSSEHPFLNHTL